MHPGMVKWCCIPIAAFIAMQTSMTQTGNLITGYNSELDPMRFFGWWSLLLVAGEFFWYIIRNEGEIGSCFDRLADRMGGRCHLAAAVACVLIGGAGLINGGIKSALEQILEEPKKAFSEDYGVGKPKSSVTTNPITSLKRLLC